MLLFFLSLNSADKPPIEELRYFLEFQIPRVWAPVRSDLPGLQRKEPVCPFLQFSMMGEKLFVSQEQVSRPEDSAAKGPIFFPQSSLFPALV